jgi:hypothetical protein
MAAERRASRRRWLCSTPSGTAARPARINQVTQDERELLETTARGLLTLQEDILDRVKGMQIVLHELFRSRGQTDIALARLRIKADLLKLKGTPSAYLCAFVGNQQPDPKLDLKKR